jgi:hypothetical protein
MLIPGCEVRTRREIESLPLWKTRLRVVIEHTHPDNQYVETYEGALGVVSSHGSSGFRICIGGDGRQGDGKWIGLLPVRGELDHRRVTVFEVMT